MLKKNFKILALLLILLSLIFFDTKVLAGETSNGVIINEVLFDPIGADLGNEWIELYNSTSTPIEMLNWKVLVAGNTFTEAASFSGLIPPHEYYLICEQLVQGCNVYVSKLGMQNGGGATDALSLVSNDGITVDQVFYDQPNSNRLRDYLNNVVLDTHTAVIGTSGESLGRDNLIDTDNSADDFYVFDTPTPGSENIGDIIDEEFPQTGDSPILYIIILIISLISGILLNKYNLFLINKWLRLQKRFQHLLRQ